MGLGTFSTLAVGGAVLTGTVLREKLDQPLAFIALTLAMMY